MNRPDEGSMKLAVGELSGGTSDRRMGSALRSSPNVRPQRRRTGHSLPDSGANPLPPGALIHREVLDPAFFRREA